MTSYPSTAAAADQFHAGIVVDDPAATMAELTASFGYEWCEQMRAVIVVETPGATEEIDLQTCYSATTPRLEIIRSIPGTVWTPAEGSGIHHLGYWVADVADASASLREGGYLVEATGRRPGGAAFWAYLRAPSGVRVELVSAQVRPMMEAYFATRVVPA